MYPTIKNNPCVITNLYGLLNLYSAHTYDDEYIIINPNIDIVTIPKSKISDNGMVK